MLITLIGYLAAFLTTASLMPEIYRTWRKKESRDLSFYWIFSLGAGQVFWLAYGLMINSMPLAVAALVSLMLAIIQAAFTIKYAKPKAKH